MGPELLAISYEKTADCYDKILNVFDKDICFYPTTGGYWIFQLDWVLLACIFIHIYHRLLVVGACWPSKILKTIIRGNISAVIVLPVVPTGISRLYAPWSWHFFTQFPVPILKLWPACSAHRPCTCMYSWDIVKSNFFHHPGGNAGSATTVPTRARSVIVFMFGWIIFSEDALPKECSCHAV